MAPCVQCAASDLKPRKRFGPLLAQRSGEAARSVLHSEVAPNHAAIWPATLGATAAVCTQSFMSPSRSQSSAHSWQISAHPLHVCVYELAANQHEMPTSGRFRTGHHEPEVLGFNVLSACLETVVHGRG
jgi:hypothetical protein